LERFFRFKRESPRGEVNRQLLEPVGLLAELDSSSKRGMDSPILPRVDTQVVSRVQVILEKPR